MRGPTTHNRRCSPTRLRLGMQQPTSELPRRHRSGWRRSRGADRARRRGEASCLRAESPQIGSVPARRDLRHCSPTIRTEQPLAPHQLRLLVATSGTCARSERTLSHRTRRRTRRSWARGPSALRNRTATTFEQLIRVASPRSVSACSCSTNAGPSQVEPSGSTTKDRLTSWLRSNPNGRMLTPPCERIAGSLGG